METTQWGEGFTQDDYKALVKAMFDGTITVSNDVTALPTVSEFVDLQDLGSIK